MTPAELLRAAIEQDARELDTAEKAVANFYGDTYINRLVADCAERTEDVWNLEAVKWKERCERERIGFDASINLSRAVELRKKWRAP